MTLSAVEVNFPALQLIAPRTGAPAAIAAKAAELVDCRKLLRDIDLFI
jgi:hypothetical protein